MTEYEFSEDYAARYLQLVSFADENAEELETERIIRQDTIVSDNVSDEVKKIQLNNLYKEYYFKYAELINLAKEEIPEEVFINTLIYLNRLVLTNINYASALGMKIPSAENIPLTKEEYFMNFTKTFDNMKKLERIGKGN